MIFLCPLYFGTFQFIIIPTGQLGMWKISSCEQEINLLSQLSHPNIVQYYGSELVWRCSVWSFLSRKHQAMVLYAYLCNVYSNLRPGVSCCIHSNNHECYFVVVVINLMLPFFRVKKHCPFTWNMSLVVPFTNYFKNMVLLGSLLFKITLGKSSQDLLTCMEELQCTGKWLLHWYTLI